MTRTQMHDIIPICTPILSADPDVKEDIMDQQKITILYCRLSNEDALDGESNSIQNQDVICQGAFLQKFQIVQQNLHEGNRGAHWMRCVNTERGGKNIHSCRLDFFCRCYSAAKFFVVPAYSSPRQRNRKVTIWARVQLVLGLKVVSLVPLVTPFSTAHWTAPA